MAWPHPDVRRRLLVGGVRSSGQSPRVPVSIRAVTGEGQTGRVKGLNLR